MFRGMSGESSPSSRHGYSGTVWAVSLSVPEAFTPHVSGQSQRLRKHCGRKSVLTQDIIVTIYYLTSKRRFSPEQISNTELKGIVSKASIYRGFDRGLFPSDTKMYLWHKGKKEYKTSKLSKYSAGRSIHDRPLDVLLCLDFGHWEVDTVESCRKGSGCVFVLHERKTRFTKTCRSLFFDANSMKNS